MPIPAKYLDFIKEYVGLSHPELADSLDASLFAHFTTEDVFNDNNLLEGYICKQSSILYGSLLITHINGKKSKNQFIYATPKFHYPVDKLDRFVWPIKRNEKALVEIYEKLDGTNILAYTYIYEGFYHLTYKTRLTAVVQNNKFSPLQDLWKQCLQLHPELEKHIWDITPNARSIAFEMYGNLNTILVWYDVPIDCRALYTVDGISGSIRPMSTYYTKLPCLRPISMIPEADRDRLSNEYNKMRAELEIQNDTERHIYRAEGAMFYIRDPDDSWSAWKCKPSSIEKIHRGISRSAIQATVRNAFENWEDPGFEEVKRLLLEEFPEQYIDDRKPTILKVLAEFKGQLTFQARIVDAMRKEGLVFTEENKANVLRQISKYFDKREMKKVYYVLAGKGKER